MKKSKLIIYFNIFFYLSILNCTNNTHTRNCFNVKLKNLEINSGNIIHNSINNQNKKPLLYYLLSSCLFLTGHCSYINQHEIDKNLTSCCIAQDLNQNIITGHNIKISNNKYNPLLLHPNFEIVHNNNKNFQLKDILILEDGSIITLNNANYNENDILQISKIDTNYQVKSKVSARGAEHTEAVKFIKNIYQDKLFILANIDNGAFGFGGKDIFIYKYDFINNKILTSESISLGTKSNDYISQAIIFNDNIYFTGQIESNDTKKLLTGSINFRGKKNWIQIFENPNVKILNTEGRVIIEFQNNLIVCGKYNDKIFLINSNNNGTNSLQKISNINGSCNDLSVINNNIIIAGSLVDRASLIVLDKLFNIKNSHTFNSDNCTIKSILPIKNNYLRFNGECYSDSKSNIIDGNISLNNFNNYCFSKNNELRFENLNNDFSFSETGIKSTVGPLIIMPPSVDFSQSIASVTSKLLCEIEDSFYSNNTYSKPNKDHHNALINLTIFSTLLICMAAIVMKSYFHSKNLKNKNLEKDKEKNFEMLKLPINPNLKPIKEETPRENNNVETPSNRYYNYPNQNKELQYNNHNNNNFQKTTITNKDFSKIWTKLKKQNNISIKLNTYSSGYSSNDPAESSYESITDPTETCYTTDANYNNNEIYNSDTVYKTQKLANITPNNGYNDNNETRDTETDMEIKKEKLENSLKYQSTSSELQEDESKKVFYVERKSCTDSEIKNSDINSLD